MSPDIVQALVKTIEMKDACTAAHTWRVALYARAMAEVSGLDHDSTERITVAAALHDVGKIDIPDHILQKPGPLTPEEFEVMKRHTVLGHERLVRMGEEDPVMLELVRHHHERWDGRGYPDALAAGAIHRAPQYFAVIDSFDAMTSVRPYRPSVGTEAVERALQELDAGRGRQYCPEAVEMFVALFRGGELDWILHHFNDACPVPEYSALGDVRGVIGTRARTGG